jgi:hypothetical protein
VSSNAKARYYMGFKTNSQHYGMYNLNTVARYSNLNTVNILKHNIIQ